MKTIFVLIDALKTSYLNENNMPFLYSLSGKYRFFSSVIPSPGFCERSELFSGLDSFDSGNFTAIGFDKELSEYKKIKVGFFRFLNVFSKKASRSFFKKYIKSKTTMQPYQIPYSMLKYFSLTEDGHVQYIKHKDIFSVLEQENKSFSLSCFTSLSSSTPSFEGVVDQLKKEIEKHTYFIPVYIGLVDAYGHKYGNDIASLKDHLKNVDEKIEEIYNLAVQNQYSVCFLGDHGMIRVTKRINIMEPLLKTKLKVGKDYLFFLDSTIARFWFFNENSKNKILYLLKNYFEQDGLIIDQTNYKEFRIPLDVKTSSGDSLYGDLIWIANKGVLISPDFFHREKSNEKGMHGYLNQVNSDGTGLFVSISPRRPNDKNGPIYLFDICDELCSMLEIPKPNTNWNRLLNE